MDGIVMKEIELYRLTEKTLDSIANARGISNLTKYYSLTDKYAEWYKEFEKDGEINLIFAQLAFHGQNATMIDGIIKFKKNYLFLAKITERFTPSLFLEKYKSNSEEESILLIVEDLRKGLVWNDKKSSPEKKDTLAKRFAKVLYRGAMYLKSFKSKKEFIDDLEAHKLRNGKYYVRAKVEDKNRYLIEYFIEKMSTTNSDEKDKCGFSVALTCDFLKELDERFDYLGKPDVHLKDLMTSFKHQEYTNDYKILKDFQDVVNEINKSLVEEGKKAITVYQFDRMVWLICSGKFFLDNSYDDKTSYLNNASSL